VSDVLDVLCRCAQKTVAAGYYGTFVPSDEPKQTPGKAHLSERIAACAHLPLIAEIKVASPTTGPLRAGLDACALAKRLEEGGAAGISVVTEPTFFKGSARLLEGVRNAVTAPLLMKDFVVSSRQVEAARDVGASSALLIQALFDRGYASCAVEEMIEFAHAVGLEVLLETHTPAEFDRALSTEADLIGINNRDLRSLDVDLTTTEKILKNGPRDARPIVSESGVKTPEDAGFLKRCGADALLVGSALMRANDVRHAVATLVRAI